MEFFRRDECLLFSVGFFIHMVFFLVDRKKCERFDEEIFIILFSFSVESWWTEIFFLFFFFLEEPSRYKIFPSKSM